MHSEELTGNGPPLLMLHGWGQSHKALKPLGKLLTPIATPFLVDLPGFGQSKPPAGVWSSFDYADALVRLMDSKGIERFSLLGHSFGGKIALSIALRYPEKVEKLVLIAAAGIKPKKTLIKKAKLQGIVTLGRLVRLWDGICKTDYFNTAFAPKFGSRDYKNAGAMRAILVKSVNEDLTALLPNIRTKTLILWGEKDRETPLDSGAKMARLIPGARFFSFPYHDHEVFKDTGAHLLERYIGKFIS